jgi:hypothetical protein
MKVDKQYASLNKVLSMAFGRAAFGKGKERHANNLPFEEQTMAKVNRLTDGGFSFGQIYKKIEEIPNLPNDQARIEEMLDIIVYAAGYVIVMLEKVETLITLLVWWVVKVLLKRGEA